MNGRTLAGIAAAFGVAGVLGVLHFADADAVVQFVVGIVALALLAWTVGIGTEAVGAEFGAAATVFGSTTGTTVAASLAETEAFLEHYQRERGALGRGELQAAWAAGLWTLLYNARKETAGGGGGYLLRLYAELGERMRRSGL